jgi:hypothetical protein
MHGEALLKKRADLEAADLAQTAAFNAAIFKLLSEGKVAEAAQLKALVSPGIGSPGPSRRGVKRAPSDDGEEEEEEEEGEGSDQ